MEAKSEILHSIVKEHFYQAIFELFLQKLEILKNKKHESLKNRQKFSRFFEEFLASRQSIIQKLKIICQDIFYTYLKNDELFQAFKSPENRSIVYYCVLSKRTSMNEDILDISIPIFAMFMECLFVDHSKLSQAGKQLLAILQSEFSDRVLWLQTIFRTKYIVIWTSS